MHVLYNVTTGDDESDEELEFDVNTDPVTDSNQKIRILKDENGKRTPNENVVT